MMILQYIILTILVCTLYVLMKKYSKKNNKDIFFYGYLTGVIGTILTKIILG